MTINTTPCETAGRHLHPADHNHYGNQCTVRPTVDEIWDATVENSNHDNYSEPEPVHTLALSEFDNAVIREALQQWIDRRMQDQPGRGGYTSPEFAASMIIETLPFPAIPRA